MGKDKTTVRMQTEATLCRLTVMIMFQRTLQCIRIYFIVLYVFIYRMLHVYWIKKYVPVCIFMFTDGVL